MLPSLANLPVLSLAYAAPYILCLDLEWNGSGVGCFIEASYLPQEYQLSNPQVVHMHNPASMIRITPVYPTGHSNNLQGKRRVRFPAQQAQPRTYGRLSGVTDKVLR